MPTRGIQRYITAGRLFPVPDAPGFPYPVWAVWRDGVDPDIAASAIKCRTTVVDQVRTEQDAILDRLVRNSQADSIGHLGQS
jgi:hypothetical protein